VEARYSGQLSPTTSQSTTIRRALTKLKKVGRKSDKSEEAVTIRFDYPRPNSIQQLEALVWKENVPCTCDICQPLLYGKKNCHVQHPKAVFSDILELNKYGRIAYSTPRMLAMTAEKPELMDLVRTTIQYFDRPSEYLNDQQLNAREALLKWIGRRIHLLNPEDGPDAEILVPGSEMLQLWHWISNLFFYGRIPEAEFLWTRECETIGRATH
jgi:hypothetical protein